MEFIVSSVNINKSIWFLFKSNQSTEHALISLIETIKKSLDNYEIVCGVFIDLQKAFETEIVLKPLSHYGIRSKENNWFHSFLTNRKQYVPIVGFFSQTKIVRCGFLKIQPWGFCFF